MTWLPPGCVAIRHVPDVPAPKKKCRWNVQTLGSFAFPSDSLFPSWILTVPDARGTGGAPAGGVGVTVLVDGADIGATLPEHAAATAATKNNSAQRRARTDTSGRSLIAASMPESAGRLHGTDGLLGKPRPPVTDARVSPGDQPPSVARNADVRASPSRRIVALFA
jgi:hypothetical protein